MDACNSKSPQSKHSDRVAFIETFKVDFEATIKILFLSLNKWKLTLSLHVPKMRNET